VFASFRRGLLALTLAGLAVRLLWVALEPATSPVADETMWVSWGPQTLPSSDVGFSPRRLLFVFHPPLYLYFVGVPFALFGTLEAVKYAQCLAGALLVPALGLAGRRAFGERAGLVAAGAAAFYPELVWFASHFWAETVFTVLLWWAVERLLAADGEAGGKAALASGLLWGLAVLTRETVLYFLPLAALWLAWRRAGGTRRAAMLLATAALVVLPWTLRNWVVFDAFVPVSTSGALNLWQGNTRLSRQEVYEEYWAVHGRIAKYEHARRRAVAAILERQPLWIFEKLRDEMPAFWAAHGQPVVHLERGAYGVVARPVALLAVAVVLVPYLAALALFVVGVAALPRHRAAVLLLGFLLFYVLLHVVAHGYPRYRLPAMPAVFLLAAHGWICRPWSAARARCPGPDRFRRLSAGATALVLALSVGPSLVAWFTRPWPPPWFAGLGIEGGAEAAPPGETPQQEAP
jgi:4-amino-4-deoxy-L-arabinose transferase-like glycosyltransferase